MIKMLAAAAIVAAFAIAPAQAAKSNAGQFPSAAEQGYGNSGGDPVWWHTAPGYDSTSCTDVLNTPAKFPKGQVSGCRSIERR